MTRALLKDRIEKRIRQKICWLDEAISLSLLKLLRAARVDALRVGETVPCERVKRPEAVLTHASLKRLHTASSRAKGTLAEQAFRADQIEVNRRESVLH